jgi:type I restriction enzyme S subunit
LIAETVSLGEIVTLQAGIGFPPALQGRKAGDYPFAKVGDISRQGRSGEPVLGGADHFVDEADVVTLRARLIPAGSVLFAKIGEAIRQNHRVIAGRPMLVDNNAMAAIPSSRVDGRYLYRFLQSIDFYRLASVTTVPALRKSELEKLQVVLPPIAEQQRIAGILDRADVLRARRREAIALLDDLTESIFIDMFGDARTTAEWRVALVGDLAAVRGGKRLPKGSEYSFLETPFRYIRVTDLRDGEIDEPSLRYLTPEVQKQISRYTVSEGDVVITIAGTIGAVAPVTASVAGANLTENAAKLVPHTSADYTAGYLSAALRDR